MAGLLYVAVVWLSAFSPEQNLKEGATMAMETSIPASEARIRFSEIIDQVDAGRFIVTKHGQEMAFIVSVRELRALEETLAVMENENLMEGLRKSLEDFRSGRVQDASDVFAELDAEFRDKE